MDVPKPPVPAQVAPKLGARRSFTPRLQELGLLVVILILGAGLTALSQPIVRPDGAVSNGFLNADNLGRNVLTYVSWIAVMAVGATFVIIAGGIDISVGSVFGLAALGAAAVLQCLPPDASAWVVVPVGVAVPLAIGALCGLVNGAVIVGLNLHAFIVTLGTLSIFRGIGLIAVPLQTLPSGDRTLPDAFTARFIGWSVDLPGGLRLQPMPMLIMLACVAWAWVYLGHMVGGRQIYAVGGNEEAARFSGLPVARVKLRVYVLSGLLAGVAGMISTGFFASANTATGEGYELIVIASAVVGGASLSGGRGTALGAALGALVIKLIENGIAILRPIDLGLFTLKLSKQYSMIIIGVAIVLAVAIDRWSERLRARRLARRGASGGIH